MDNYLTNSEICEIIRKIINILDNNISIEKFEQYTQLTRYTVRGPDLQWFNNHGILDKGLDIFVKDSYAITNYNIDIVNFNMFSWYCLYDFIPYVVDIYNKNKYDIEYKNKYDIEYCDTNKIQYLNGYPDLIYASDNDILEYYITVFIKMI
jgi:hypothetical protein